MKLSLVTVATGKYLEYWIDLARSISEYTRNDINLDYHIFTDRIEDAMNFANTININIIVHEIDSQDWLNGTLLRYRHYRRYFKLISGDVILHLDADMLVVKNFVDDLFDTVSNNTDKVNFVYHPGFWRQKKFYLPYLLNHKTYRSEINILLKLMLGKSLGSWETRLESTAYTPEHLQIAYFCGAVWFGKREIVYKFISEVDELIIEDLKNGITAVWHDESYLNNWAAHNMHNSIEPKYCYLLGKAHLSNVEPLIVAINKEENK
jgi:hypothetical protein